MTSPRSGSERAPLRALVDVVADEPAINTLASRPGSALAVPEHARAITVAGLSAATDRRPILVAVPTTSDADRLHADLVQYLGDDVELFPAWETLPFERVSPSVETMGRRLRTMWRLRNGDACIVVAPVRALVQRLGPHVEDVEPVTISPRDRVDPEELVERLVTAGYRREYQVEARGEVAVRGSIVDVYPSTADAPVRIDLWGDEVDRLTTFSVSDQRSRDDIDCVEIFPCRELLTTPDVRQRAERLVAAEPWGREHWERLSEGLTFDGMESWLPWLTEEEHVLLDLIPKSGLVLLVEPRRMRDRAQDIIGEEEDLAGALAKTWDVDPSRQQPRLHLPFDRLLTHTEAPASTVTNVAEGPDVATIETQSWPANIGDGSGLVEQVGKLQANKVRVVLAGDTAGSAQRLKQRFVDAGVTPGATVVAALDRGVILPRVRLAVLAEPDVTGRRRAHRAARAPKKRDAAGFFEDLKPGDYVVHHHHGVARYAGMVKRTIGGSERDYLLLEYRGDDKLYIPTDQIDTVRHYTGGETPSLSKLGGSEWAKTKSRVRSAVTEIAQELVVLYQRRVNSSGVAFSMDTPWQHELEEAFPYKETPDQLKAIQEVKADMESERPMDRLVCGDVGFGKTEVAIRAAFKAVQDGYQVAVLVPTTLLAQQHFQTFSDRFSGYPVRVEVLSRFLTPGQAKKVVQGVKDGDVDLVIGTHRLLSADIEFKKLGLLIVDEEQRFGVQHKEAMKKLKHDIDVLTLSATPIPRTLEMSLTGIRDLTLLQTPPAERQPILTYVGEQDERAVAEAIRRELLREGQVFFVHNRVKDIEDKAMELRELVPEARIAVAHGQMDEGTLEMSLTGIRDLTLLHTPPAERQPILTYVGEDDDRAVAEAIRRELLREGQVFFVHNRVHDIDQAVARVVELVPEARVAMAHGQMDEGTLEQVVYDFWEGKFDVLVCTTIIESGIDMPTVNTLVVDRADRLGLGQLHQLRGRVGRAGSRAYAYLFHPRDQSLSEEAYERLKTIGEATELGSGFKIAMRDLEIRGAGNLLGEGQSGHIAAVGYDLYVQMVAEAVAELKGEPVKEPAEIKLELPLDASLPPAYVAKEELRLEAYRRLAAVTTAQEVEDIRAEWEDRYGPVPTQADALLRVARLRAEAHRVGVKELTVTANRTGPGWQARISPIALRASATVRLRRLAPSGIYKEDLRQLVVPLSKQVDPADALTTLLAELVPDEAASVAS